MPDERAWVARTIMGVGEYEAFVAWYQELYGPDAPVPPNEEGIVDLPIYSYWQSQGRPGFTSVTEVTPEEQEIEAARWTPPEPEEPEPTEPPEVISQGGYDYEYVITGYDPTTGQPIMGWQNLGPTPSREMTDYQRAQIDLQIRKLDEDLADPGLTDYQKAQLELDREQLEMQKRQLEWQMRPEAITPWQEAQLGLQERELEWQMGQTPAREKALEQRLWEQQQLGELTGPADWIKRWQLIKGIEKRTAGARVERAELREIKAGEPLMNIATGLPQVSPTRVARAGERTAQAESEWGAAKEVGTPRAPGWLPKFTPSQVAGEPITKARTKTPSGQMWARTPWSEREGLRGYTEYAGYRPYAEILEHMAMMQPTAPSGAGARRWQPARQRR